MKIDTKTIVTMTEANQNFSRVAKKADEYGVAIIFKNNRPKYQLIDLDREATERELTDDEKIDIIARQIIKEYKPAFLELAK
ncbi:MAG: type II toxin-antitoxin system Phd/YefM family antitoxin [Clostridia bacterium]|nr:type II toxin-antitoxin system Phd/YefM family antitoxin [Clostridia bacterium]MBR3295382.1 type II toxin-antitoxin system Phd/YefM family antitoxin [Clostridia bacterium]